jgi:beta-phosphoglucomutase
MQKVATLKELSTKFPKVSTYLFDMDGTIMFTEHLHAMAINQVLTENNERPFEQDVLEEICIGLNDEVVFEKLQKDKMLSQMSLEKFLSDKKSIFSQLLKEIEPKEIFNPKVKSLLKNIKKSKAKLALVTSSEHETAYELLNFLKIHDLFDLIVTREDTQKNKPHPEPYLYAFEKLGNINPKECLIFEDSPVGLTAAQKSNANVFKVEWYFK